MGITLNTNKSLTETNRLAITNSLHEIFTSLANPNNQYLVDHPSLLGGKSGVALFLFYYGRQFQTPKANEIAFHYLHNALEQTDKLNEFSVASGYAGLGWTLSNLNHIGIVEDDDLSILTPINELSKKAIEDAFEQKNFDLLYGIIGIGQYILENQKFPNRTESLELVCDRLLDLAIHDGYGVTWPNFFSVKRQFPEDLAYDLGLAHGVPSVISFLCIAFQNGIRQKKISEVIPRAINWIMREEKRFDGCGFVHNFVGKNNGAWSRLAWCNGDLSVAICLLHAFNTFHTKAYFDDAIRIARLTTTRTIEHSGIAYNLENNFVDACFCHGVGGLALIYKVLFSASGDLAFAKFGNTLLEFEFQNLNPTLPLAGYIKFLEDRDEGSKYSNGDTSLIEGLSGVGLSYLSLLSERPLEWQRLFLLFL